MSGCQSCRLPHLWAWQVFLFSSSAIQHIKQLPEQQTAPPERLGRWGQGLARTQQLLGKQLAQVRPLLTSNLYKGQSGLQLS